MCQYSYITNTGKAYSMDVKEDLIRFSKFHLQGDEKIFIVDIDDTLRSSVDRVSYIPSPEKIAACGSSPNLAWDEFNSMCYLDKPITKNIELVNGLIKEKCTVVFLTSCTNINNTDKITLAQLKSYGFTVDCISSHLVMRGVDNQQDPITFKKDFVEGTILNEVHDGRVLCIDDNQGVIDMFQNFGFETIKV